jgi:hypothetical protein
MVFEHQVSITTTNDSTLSTISDEAFAALFLLKNSFDHWVDIYQLQKGQVHPVGRTRELEQREPKEQRTRMHLYD